MRYNELITQLNDDRSSAFLGSAIALSCYSLFMTFDEEKAEDFLLLSDADSLLYKEQVSLENIYSEEDIKKALSIYDDCLFDLSFALLLNGDQSFRKIISSDYEMFEDLYNLSYQIISKKRDITFNRKKEEPLQNKMRYVISLNDKNMIDVILPLLIVFRKLLKRKHNGKKPFSFNEEVNEVLFLLDNMIQNREIDKENILSLSSFAKRCTEEIKTESLRNDYFFLSDMFSLMASYFN